MCRLGLFGEFSHHQIEEQLHFLDESGRQVVHLKNVDLFSGVVAEGNLPISKGDRAPLPGDTKVGMVIVFDHHGTADGYDASCIGGESDHHLALRAIGA